jgi:hypothetical protein
MDGWETKPQSGAKQARSSIDPYILLKPKKEIGILMVARIARRFSWLFLYRRETQHRDIVGRVVRARHE